MKFFEGKNIKGKKESGSQNDLYAVISLLTDLISKEKIIEIIADNRKIARGTWKYDEEFKNQQSNVDKIKRGER